MTDPTTAVYQQFWGGAAKPPAGAPAGAPADAFIMYDGATPAHYPWAQLPGGGWWTWDLRGSLFTFVHDLMRFRKLSDVETFDPTIEHGLYDWTLYAAKQAYENNQILRKLATAAGVDISQIVAE